MKRVIANIIVAICVLATTALNANEKNLLWEEQHRSQIEFQRSHATLLSKQIPEYKKIIFINRDLQITMSKMRSLEYYYLLANYPEKIIKNEGISRWVNFEWSEENRIKLLNSNEEYTQLASKYNSLKKENQGHSQWPVVREKFSSIRESKEYIELYSKLMNTLKDIEKKL